MTDTDLELLIADKTAELKNEIEQLRGELAECKQVETALRKSENQLRAVAETASDAIITIDEQGIIVFVNQAAERIFGYSQQEMLNKELTLLMPEYLRHLHRAGFSRYKVDGSRHVSWEAVELPGLHKNGNEIPLEIAFAEFKQDGLRFFTGIARDISERNSAQTELQRSERLYRTLVRNFPNGGVALFDRELRYLIADGAGLPAELSRENLEGRTIWEVFSPRVSNLLEPVYRAALAGQSSVGEITIDGRVYLRHAVPVIGEHGEIFAGMVMTQDITERKRADEALREAELAYRNLVESVQAIVWRANARTFQFSFVSKEAETLLGYPAGQWVSDPKFWASHIHPDDRDRVWSLRVEATEGKRDHQLEYRMIAADGRVVWLRDIVRVVLENDVVTELIGVIVDVTTRKLAEETAIQNERKFSAIFQTIPDVVGIMRLRDGMMMDLNDAWTTQTGYLKSERVGKKANEFNIYADKKTREGFMESLVKNGEVTNYEGEYRIKDGSVRYGLTSARVVELGGEQCVVAISRDITEHKAAQEAIRLSETKFRTLAETTPSAIIVYRFDDNRIQYVNAAMQKISGYSEAELLTLTIWDLIHPDSVELVRRRRRARLRGEYVSPRLELKLITKDGEERWVDQSVGTIEFEGQSALIVTAFDITDRKRAEEALRRSEERYRLIVENQTEFIVKWLPDGTRTFVNDSYCRYFGISEADCIGTSFFPLIAPEFHEGIRTRMLSLTPDASEYTEEHQSLVAGELRWQQWTNRGIMDSDGNLVELLSTGRDITDRKTAEQALQESEARLRLLNERFSIAVESAGIGVWDLDLVTNKLTLDQQMNRLYRVDPEESSGAYEAWASRVHPDDLPRVNAEVLQAIKGIKRFDTNFRVVWPSGEARHIRAFARVLSDDNGRPVRMTGINYDITDRKRAEKALIQSEAHYRALVENTPDIIARFDSNCRYLFVNSALLQVSSIKPENFIDKSLREVGFSEKQASFCEGVINEVFRTQMPFETEFEVEEQTGVRVYEWRVYPEFDEQGRMQTVLSINRDVTERRRAEEGLKQSHEQLRALSSHLQSVREEERTRIAREVHDVLGQALTALKIDLYSVQRGLSIRTDSGAERLAEKMKSMSGLIDSTIQTVRRIATELRPGILDDLGLVAAVEWQANDFQARTGITCNVTSHVDYLDLDRERSTATFRIFQETLTNVARHAAASRVEITLTSDDQKLVLEVKDNGKGITHNDIEDSRSLGLLGMRERAQLLGGDLSIAGTLGHGTLVTVTIPLLMRATASGLVE